MLGSVKILSKKEADEIIKGLETIKDKLIKKEIPNRQE